MKIDSNIGRRLFLFLAIYYLFIILLYSIFTYSNNINIAYSVALIIILFAFIVLAYKLVLNARTQIYILHLFIIPFLIYSITIGLSIFPLPALLSVSILIIIYLLFMLSPFILPNITRWITKNILHSKPKLTKLLFVTLIVIIIIAIIFNSFLQSYIYQYYGEEITYIGGNLYLPISAKGQNYAIFVDFYLLSLFVSLAISVIIKSNRE